MPIKVFITGAFDGISNDTLIVSLDNAVAAWQCLGAIVIVPPVVAFETGCKQWKSAMKEITQQLLNCDGVQFLPGWELSPMARVCYSIAKNVEIPVYLPANSIVDIDSYNAIIDYTPRRHITQFLKLCNAINNVFGVTFAQMRERTRKNKYVMARMAFINELTHVFTNVQIARILNISEMNVRWYLRQYTSIVNEKCNPKLYEQMMAIQGWRQTPETSLIDGL